MSDIHVRFYKTLLGNKGKFHLEIDKHINFGEFIALFGKSGAGKTSILRILSGLDSVEQGYIRVGDEVWLDSQKGIHLAPQKRHIGFVFQNYALFPHLNVYENICFGLKNKQDRIFADELIALMDLQPLKKAHIHQLSGGQSQRVALARTLTSRPTLLLLDEPFSALDNIMAQTLQNKLKTIHQHFNLTTLLVSHNLSEIFALTSRTFVLNRGKIVREGNNEEVFLSENAVSQKSTTFTLTGEILDIRFGEQSCLLQVLCNHQILSIPYDINAAKAFGQGEQVLITQALLSPQIHKINLN